MSILYPRLLDRAAKDLFEAYAGSTDATTLSLRAATRHPAAVFAATGGRRVTDQELRSVRDAVLAAARRAGFPNAASPTARGAFDAEVARLLHSTMGVVPAEASVRSMWAFVALVLLPDVAYWRFPDPPKDRVLATDITRHAFGRLWWRAHLLHDPEADEPYALTEVFAEAAFDQIFARRKALGGSRALIRGLAATWPDVELGLHSERDVLRETLKRLLRHGAFQEFEALPADVIRAEIEDVVALSVEGLGG